METQKKRGQGWWGGRPKPSRDPASAVGRPTAAVDVELSGPGSSSLLTHTGIVCMAWEHVCVCVCVCVYGRGNIKPFLAEAEQNRSPHCDGQTSGWFSEKHMAPSGLQSGRC